MQVVVRRIGREGLSLAGLGDSGHWIPMDTSVAGDGQAGANSPMELILIALGGCTAMDVLAILKKKRIVLDDFEVVVSGDRVDSTPRVFSSAAILYRFFGSDLRKTDLDQAVALSQDKYCSVAAMLRDAVQLSHEIEIHPPRSIPGASRRSE